MEITKTDAALLSALWMAVTLLTSAVLALARGWMGSLRPEKSLLTTKEQAEWKEQITLHSAVDPISLLPRFWMPTNLVENQMRVLAGLDSLTQAVGLHSTLITNAQKHWERLEAEIHKNSEQSVESAADIAACVVSVVERVTKLEE